MAKYRKKPVVIEAVQFTGTPESSEEVAEFLGGFHATNHQFDADTTKGLTIKTLEGEHHASVGDWIIRGVKGEFYPCKPDIFAATYEPVDSISEEGK